MLFTGRDSEGNKSLENHLAELVAVLGPPPLELLRRSLVAEEFFDIDSDGNGDGASKASTSIPSRSLEDSEKRLEGQSKALFLQFIRKMLQWEPEKRPTAAELLENPWLTSKD